LFPVQNDKLKFGKASTGSEVMADLSCINALLAVSVHIKLSHFTKSVKGATRDA